MEITKILRGLLLVLLKESSRERGEVVSLSLVPVPLRKCLLLLGEHLDPELYLTRKFIVATGISKMFTP